MINIFIKSCQKCLFHNSPKLNLPKLCKNIQPRLFCKSAIDVNTNVTKDVILYKYKNDRLFRIVNLFGFAQFGFWTYLAYFARKTLRDAPVDTSKETTWWRKVNLGENKYRNGITTFSILLGAGILFFSWMYSLRSVKYLILMKGGQKVTIVTYTPTGHNRMITVGLKNISCAQQRIGAQTQLPIKVRGHRLYYILDMKGEFVNPTLFDSTAGLKRKL